MSLDDTQIALHRLEHGEMFPYDAPDKWWNGTKVATPAKDWAHAAARGVVADLMDRRDIKHPFNNVDEEVRVEMISSLADIIRVAEARRSKVEA